MKHIKLNKNYTKVKLLLLVAGVIILAELLFLLIKKINAWYDTHYFQFNQIVQVKFNKPIEIKERKVSIQEVIKVINNSPLPETLTPTEKYICEKWGPYECKVALAVAKMESGLREEAFNVNSNGTIDVGIYQINSVHFKKPGCSLKEIVEAKKNIDCAYAIWKASGWSIWTVFSTGSFKNGL